MLLRLVSTLAFCIVCTTQLVAQINCPPNLPLTLVGNTDYCVGSSGASLSINESYDNYEWLPTAETTQGVLLTAGNYEVVVTHYTGCTDTLEFTVAQVSNPPQPTIIANGPLEFCQGESVVLSVPIQYPYYDWSSGSVSDEITVFESGTYNVSVSDWIGCESSSNSIQVVVNPLPVAAFSPNLSEYDIEFNNLSENATDYEWNFGDGNFSSDFEPTHTYSADGSLEMWLVAANDCGTDTAFLNLESVGISERTESEISIYPNPSNGLFFIDASSFTNESVRVRLNDLTGKTIFESSVILGNSVLPIQTEGLSAGTYVLEIASQNQIIDQKVLLFN